MNKLLFEQHHFHEESDVVYFIDLLLFKTFFICFSVIIIFIILYINLQA
jgi:hypothetical protein